VRRVHSEKLVCLYPLVTLSHTWLLSLSFTWLLSFTPGYSLFHRITLSPGYSHSHLVTLSLTWLLSLTPGYSLSYLVTLSLTWLLSLIPGYSLSHLVTLSLTWLLSLSPGYSLSHLVTLSFTGLLSHLVTLSHPVILYLSHPVILYIPPFCFSASDDVFTIYAALSSGPNCYILSTDEFRQHTKHLATKQSKHGYHLFNQWQSLRQIPNHKEMFRLYGQGGYTNNEDFKFSFPLQTKCTPQCHDGCWHVPVTHPLLSLRKPKFAHTQRWLCLPAVV